MVWSTISEIEANPKKIKPIGINLFLFIRLKLLNDFIPNINGMTAAWIWANSKIEKNKINPHNLLILKLIYLSDLVIWAEKYTIAPR